MKFKDVTLKNIHTLLPLVGITFYRVYLHTETAILKETLIESIDAEMISILNRDCGPDAVFKEYENDTVIRIEYTNINGGIYEDIYLAERN